VLVLNISSAEAVTDAEYDLDLDRELRATGPANLAVGWPAGALAASAVSRGLAAETVCRVTLCT
jgi:hypothetical protein